MFRPGDFVQIRSVCLAFMQVVLLFGSTDIAIADQRSVLPPALPVDLELVLATDVSTSMDRDERRLQMTGFADAFRDATVLRAVKSGQFGRIAVTYVEWGGPSGQRIVIPWMVIDGARSAGEFSTRLDNAIPSRIANGTAIGDALLFASSLIASNEYAGSRRVIDISGDGASSRGVSLVAARETVLALGITINALPIDYSRRQIAALDPIDKFRPKGELARYFEREVIGGPDAFSETVETAQMFTYAIRRKLIREVAGRNAIQVLAGDSREESGVAGPARILQVALFRPVSWPRSKVVPSGPERSR